MPVKSKANNLGDNFRPSKSLGQNFLHDKNILRRIVKLAEIKTGDEVLEIGPGLGALTTFLADDATRVVAIEKDKRLEETLGELFGDRHNVELIFQDALKADFREFYSGKKLKVVANLPYSISSPILIKLLGVRDIVSSMVVMLQLEIGERICAPPGNKTYGSLSVLLQTFMDVKIEFRVSPECFWPKPRVDSAVLTLLPLKKPRTIVSDEQLFEKVIRAAFSSRRKMIGNSLRSILPKESVERVLESSGIDKSRRAVTLNIEEFGKLAEEVYLLEKSDT